MLPRHSGRWGDLLEELSAATVSDFLGFQEATSLVTAGVPEMDQTSNDTDHDDAFEAQAPAPARTRTHEQQYVQVSDGVGGVVNASDFETLRCVLSLNVQIAERYAKLLRDPNVLLAVAALAVDDMAVHGLNP